MRWIWSAAVLVRNGCCVLKNLQRSFFRWSTYAFRVVILYLYLHTCSPIWVVVWNDTEVVVCICGLLECGLAVRCVSLSAHTLFFLLFDLWLVGESLEQTTAMSSKRWTRSRRVVLVSAKPIAGRVWKSLRQDVCIKTCKLLLHWLALQQLCGSLSAAGLHTNLLRVRGH